MTVVRELVAKFGLDFDTKSFENGNQIIEFLRENLQAVATVAVGSAAVGLAYVAREAGNAAREIRNTAEAFGFASNELMAWQTVAESAGVQAEQFRAVMGAFSRQATTAASNPALKRAFEEIGVALEDAQGNARSTNDVLRDTLVGLSQMENPTQRAALAMQLLGEQGARLIPAFEDGGAALDGMLQSVQGLFGEDIDDAAEKSQALEAQLSLLELSFTSLKTTIALEILPILTSFVRGVSNFFRPIVEAARGTNVLKIAFGALGIAALGLGIKMLLPFLPVIATFALIAAGIAAIILIVDDLVAMFTGGKSVIGEFIDEIGGVGTAASFVEKCKKAWDDLQEGWQEAFRFWKHEAMPAMREAWVSMKEGFSEVAEFVTITWNRVKTFFTVELPAAFDIAKVNAVALVDQIKIKIDEMIEKAIAAKDTLEALGRFDLNGAAQGAQRFQQAGAVAEVRTAVVRSTAAAQSLNIRQSTQVGQIVVQGSDDPEATAEAVQQRIRETNSRDIQAARDALVRTAD